MPKHPEFLTAFRAGIGSDALPPGVTATAPDEAAARFAVYRNNVATSLIDALAATFPVIERLVGVDFFRAMARDFAQAHGPRSPVLIGWGADFPAYLAGFAPLAAYPYMADVARIEWARGRAYHAADATPLPPADLLAAVAHPERLYLRLHPSVQVLALDHPAVTIWAANQPTPQAQAGRGPQTALIWRTVDFDVPVAAIDPGDAAMIRAIVSGANLLGAAETAALTDPDHSPQPMLLRLMQAGAIVIPEKAMP